METDDRYLQKAAIEGLICLADARAVQPLIGTLGSNDQDVRALAAKALGPLRDTRALRPLIDALADDSDDVREVVAEALGDLGDARAADALIQGLKDGHYCVNNAIVQALGCLGDRRCVEPLLRLAEKQWYDEVLIYSVVARLGDSRGVERLIEYLGLCGDHKRAGVAAALKTLGEPKWETVVTGHADDLARLGTLGDARIIPPLVKRLSDGSSKHFRLPAARGLLQIASCNPNLLRADWQHVAKLLREPHTDNHSDDNRSSDCSHSDHADKGIGLAFPEQPSMPQSLTPRTPPPAQVADQTVAVVCPKCGKTLNAPKASAGRTGRCPACNTRFPIPAQPGTGGNAMRDF